MIAGKIQNTHCERIAFVYVRQSTPLQVLENRESTERQYRLRDRAIELGWPPTQVEVIDEDQGRTGSASAHRSGFQRLVSEVGLGKVGVVLMLEASRLARNNSDWYRLIEICGVSGTLIADESAVYNPREPNDRLLLGVKGTLSEAELFTLRTRLYEGRWNKARKGRLHFPLPVGYVRAADGDWALDPDTQVRERLDYLFESFRRHGIRSKSRSRSQRARIGTTHASNLPGGIWLTGLEAADAQRGGTHLAQSGLRGCLRVWPLGVLQPAPVAKDGQSISPCAFHGTMAGEYRRAPSGLPQLGGICEEPGATAAELEPGRKPRGGT